MLSAQMSHWGDRSVLIKVGVVTSLGEHQLVLVGALAYLVLRLPATPCFRKLPWERRRQSSHQQVAELRALVAQLGEDDILPRAGATPTGVSKTTATFCAVVSKTFSGRPYQRARISVCRIW